ncbi:TmcC family electron transfer complex membrane anchor subunit [Desulfocurvus vexinensis]|uniref:TmcC family electron transfer complex membrane anchor subunit n=1 Tax=Desulfocurvus vexinensis TaxID=399548 RepID=UPI00048D976A|nr:nitrate reductase [Desulfocurvus vexinensis]
MHGFYALVSGPLVWVAFAVFLGGGAWKLWRLLSTARRKDVFIHEYWSWSHAVQSYLHWLTPFGSENSRRQPVMTVVTFLFHLGVVVVPLFTLGHLVLLEEGALGLSWPALPDAVVDAFAFVVLGGCAYFGWRRLALPQVRSVTSAADWGILALVAAPFATGILAYHGIGDALLMTSLHMLAGEVMLAAIPFTRLSHMFTFWVTRGYTASEFGSVRHVRDW